jgi:hypothetical protein
LRPQGLWPASTQSLELHPETEAIASEEREDLYTARAE